MNTNFSTSTKTNYAVETQQLLNSKRFVMGVVLPLGIGVSMYALTATGMIVYDIFSKLLG